MPVLIYKKNSSYVQCYRIDILQDICHYNFLDTSGFTTKQDYVNLLHQQPSFIDNHLPTSTPRDKAVENVHPLCKASDDIIVFLDHFEEQAQLQGFKDTSEWTLLLEPYLTYHTRIPLKCIDTNHWIIARNTIERVYGVRHQQNDTPSRHDYTTPIQHSSCPETPIIEHQISNVDQPDPDPNSPPVIVEIIHDDSPQPQPVSGDENHLTHLPFYEPDLDSSTTSCDCADINPECDDLSTPEYESNYITNNEIHPHPDCDSDESCRSCDSNSLSSEDRHHSSSHRYDFDHHHLHQHNSSESIIDPDPTVNPDNYHIHLNQSVLSSSHHHHDHETRQSSCDISSDQTLLTHHPDNSDSSQCTTIVILRTITLTLPPDCVVLNEKIDSVLDRPYTRLIWDDGG